LILSRPDLQRATERGEVVFDPPLEQNQWGQASVDLRLGFSFTRLQELSGITLSVADGLPALGASGFWKTIELKTADDFGRPQSFELEPRGFVLAMTYESIKVPPNMIALVEGRSTYARVGLSMHQTAPWIQPGWSGPIVLEVMNNGPLTVKLTPLIDRPCQLTFFKLSRTLPRNMLYGSRPEEFYADQQHPLRHERKSASTAVSRRPRQAAPKKRRSRPR
jgi:dCTP deaminase